MRLFVVKIIFVVQVSSSDLLKEGPKWDDLRVKFGEFNCASSAGFFHMPRTEEEARNEGFQLLSNCMDEDAPVFWTGKRYAKTPDHNVVLLYDVNGYIAGIQSGFQRNGVFPPLSQVNNPFVFHEGLYYITFYFVEPSIICTTGRSEILFRSTGTGTGLFLQMGRSPSQVMQVPLRESELQNTLWIQQLCLPTMGQHYRYNISQHMDCDDISPVFLMYNNGWLDGFGWTVLAILPSPLFEHTPLKNSSSDPDCFQDHTGNVTSLHVYLTTPCNRSCPKI